MTSVDTLAAPPSGPLRPSIEPRRVALEPGLLSWPRPRREDEELVRAARHELAALERARADQPESETLERLCELLEDVVNTCANTLTVLIRAETTVTVKLLTRGADGEARVHTFLRDLPSRNLRIDGPNDFPYADNTAFTTIIETHKGRAGFASNNLVLLRKLRKYKNTRPGWDSYYNTTSVVPIPGIDHKADGIVGFLCADSRHGDIEQQKVGYFLAMMADHVHNILGFALDFGQSSTADPALHRASEALGWSFADDGFRPRNVVQQGAFEELIGRLEQLRPTSIARDADTSRALASEIDAPRAPIGAPMLTDEDYASLLADEEELASTRRATILRHPVTEEAFLEALEKSAPGNPYAEGLLAAAKAKAKV